MSGRSHYYIFGVLGHPNTYPYIPINTYTYTYIPIVVVGPSIMYLPTSTTIEKKGSENLTEI